MPPASSTLLRADALFHRELRGVSLAVEPGRFTLISGGVNSGAGALLRLLGLLDRAEIGEVWYEGQPTCGLDDATRLELRNRAFGYVFAEPFLLDSFSVAENVAMPLFKISGFDIEQARIRTAQMLDFTGLAAVADATVLELSLPDQHKVAFARALAVAPRVVIAEDTGLHLTPAGFRDFATLLRAAPEALGVAIIATSPAAAETLVPDREIRLEEGIIAADSHPVIIEEAPAHD